MFVGPYAWCQLGKLGLSHLGRSSIGRMNDCKLPMDDPSVWWLRVFFGSDKSTRYFPMDKILVIKCHILWYFEVTFNISCFFVCVGFKYFLNLYLGDILFQFDGCIFFTVGWGLVPPPPSPVDWITALKKIFLQRTRVVRWSRWGSRKIIPSKTMVQHFRIPETWQNEEVHSRSLTACPWKMVVGRRSFPIGFR